MIKNRLRVLLAEHDMTQKDLAVKTGIRECTVSDYVRGKSKMISLQNMELICETLDCQPGDIFLYIPDEG